MSLKGKVAIVTGSSRGIGLQIAENFAQLGATVVVTATKQETCDKVAKALEEKYGVTTLGIQANVSNSEDVQNLVRQVVDKFGGIDILVNNAGIAKDNLVLRLTEEDWSSVLKTNLDSVFYFTKAVIRPMMKKKWGRIINITSVVGVTGNAGQANYAASKAGIIGFTKSVAKEYGAKGITCNAIAPGFIETDMIESLPKEYLNNIIEAIPQKRMGQQQDVANAVSFLASDYSGYITGQVIQVDGGMVM